MVLGVGGGHEEEKRSEQRAHDAFVHVIANVTFANVTFLNRSDCCWNVSVDERAADPDP